MVGEITEVPRAHVQQPDVCLAAAGTFAYWVRIDLGRAIDYAIANRDRFGSPIRVISNSWGTGIYEARLLAALDHAGVLPTDPRDRGVRDAMLGEQGRALLDQDRAAEAEPLAERITRASSRRSSMSRPTMAGSCGRRPPTRG